MGVTYMNRRRSVHFRGVTRLSQRRGMGVEWAWTPIPWPWTPCIRLKLAGDSSTAANDFLFKKKRCTVLMTSHITWRHQYSATDYVKIKVCMKWVSEFEALHFTARPLLHCTVFATLHHHYSTALTTLHNHYSMALYSLHCTTATPLYSLHCTTTSPLDNS